MHAIKELGTKLLPSLQSQAIKADIETTTYVEPPSSRNLGRAVLAVLRKSNLDDAGAEVAAIGTHPAPASLPRSADIMVRAKPTLEAWEEKQRQLQIEHDEFAGQPDGALSEPAGPLDDSFHSAGLGDDVDAATPNLASSGLPRGASSLSLAAASINPAAADQGGPVSSSGSPISSSPVERLAAGGGNGAASGPFSTGAAPRIPEHHERPHAYKVESRNHNGAHMLWHSELRRWFFFDNCNVEHGAQAGVRGDDAKAVARLEDLPKSSGPWQEHPWRIFGGDTLNTVPR